VGRGGEVNLLQENDTGMKRKNFSLFENVAIILYKRSALPSSANGGVK
jgi:hypothetical protein